jgi:RNA polymerase sigma factor (sigma-70 family)
MEQAPAVALGRMRRPLRTLRLASDERLVAALRGGDERAFEVVYDRHHRAILGFCRHMLGSREEAEDAVQYTFLAAYRDLLADERKIHLRAWLFTIARNRCLSILRSRREHVDIDAVEPSTDGLAATVERREDVRELLGDLARLPDDQRAALLLSELGALDHEGVAAVLNCRREQVKALVFQARSSLAADRDARAIPCEEIRAELANARGGALRRGPLCRHVRGCPGCRAFGDEVARQRKLMAVALPVIPSIALKAGVLHGALGAGSGGGAGAGATAGAGGLAGTAGGSGATAGAGGGLAGLVSAGAAKVGIGIALAGAVAGGGAATIHAVGGSDRPASQARPSPDGGRSTTPAATPGGSQQPAATSSHKRSQTTTGASTGTATTPSGQTGGAGAAGTPTPGAHGNGSSSAGSPAPGQAGANGRAHAKPHPVKPVKKPKRIRRRLHPPVRKVPSGSTGSGTTKSPPPTTTVEADASAPTATVDTATQTRSARP